MKKLKILENNKRNLVGFFRYMGFSLFLLAIYAVIFYIFHRYDWGHPIIKLICFLILLAIIIFNFYKKSKHQKYEYNKSYLKIEIIIWTIFILLILFFIALPYLKQINSPAQCDVGDITHNTIKLLFLGGKNPYSQGYPYGPATLLFYFPSVWFGSFFLKWISLFYLLCLFIIVFLFVNNNNENKNKLQLISLFLFVVLFIIIPERLWYETFVQGATDILPVLLVLISILFVSRDNSLFAGIFAGLSLSTKFSIAPFYIILFIRRKIKLSFILGLFIGVLPIIFFLIFGGMSVINKMFIIHLSRNFDSTSLYSITPSSLHFIFPLIQVIAVLFFIFINFKKKIEYKTLLIHLTILLAIIEVSYIEIHGNHLLWFVPLFAVIFMLFKNKMEKSST
jgi:hypothetical protein